MLEQQNSNTMIYLAEDDQDDRVFFMEALHEVNPEMTVRISEDGQHLLTALREPLDNTPMIIFLDINMPRKNGFECLKEIRGNSHFDAVKVIMFSTSNSRLHIELSYRLGADYYAVKPISFAELKELLRAVVEMDWNKTPANKKYFLLTGTKTNTM